ncbi:polysaccharide deacetylase family protein [Rubellimicrobium aerolatum]|uniref:Chitooligosaccharide deacetylase n=1 Tax=Rubellimicrobium aerolatum TaxID=490979 RepID=A0ABW0SF38_9RHOB|nr:polysaccharide deacetylase family protein [Rubellimicrobium aerolatum]MBP1807067.1 peptidoglycan/xylan/chitin deacetylase (PgdA/CDA1 family) [Rubellimicrobium aerolatum]
MGELLLPGPFDDALASILRGLSAGRMLRVVNFHATPAYRREEYRRQVAAYADRFAPVTPANFDAAFDGTWADPRPGLMPVLFEGWRDNVDVMLPILEEFGFKGWFFVPSAFPGIGAQDQRAYADAHTLRLPRRDEYPGQRVALTWDEAGDAASRGHGFACHSRSHFDLQPDTPDDVLREEIHTAAAEMRAGLGQPAEIFCWLHGAEAGVNPRADAMLKDAGFRYLFSNFKVQRLA